MKNNISDFSKCSNCGACYNACPTDAISVKDDELFYSLSVDETKCIHCGLCKKSCPVNEQDFRQKTMNCYAVIHNDELVVKNSSSGGAFSAIAEVVMENGGVVYGAMYAENFRTVQMGSTDIATLDGIRRSKYVESKVGYSFREVKANLESGRQVLYCGAPCQIAGLKRYLCKEYDNLLTCDFSCGGMPSHRMYNEYLEGVQQKLRAEICDVNFRPKSYGWTNHCIQICGENGRTYRKLASEDPYFNCFINTHMSVRDYCLECQFADNHYADIILADFWKFWKGSNVRNDDKGISLVITNSLKGETMMRQISKKVAMTFLDTEKSSYNLVNKFYNSDFHAQRDIFLKKCRDEGFILAVRDGKLDRRLKFKLKYKIKKLLGK